MQSSDMFCEYKNCGLTIKDAKSLNITPFKLHSFAAQKVHVLTQWIINSGAEHLCNLSIAELQRKRLCSQHFHTSCYKDPKRLDVLLPDAVPFCHNVVYQDSASDSYDVDAADEEQKENNDSDADDETSDPLDPLTSAEVQDLFVAPASHVE